MALRVRYVSNTARPKAPASGGRPAALIDEAQTFHLAAIRVDNYSGKWLKIESEGIFIPPFTAGYVVDTFVQTQRLLLSITSPVSLIGGQVNDGEVIVSVYDTPVLPSTGTFVGYAQFQTLNYAGAGISPALEFDPADLVAGQVLEFGYTIPVYFYQSNAFLSPRRLAQRGMSTATPVGPTAVAASPAWTALATVGDPLQGANISSLFMFSFSSDTSGLVEWRLSGNPTPLWSHYIMAMTPYTLVFGGNGLPMSVANQQMQVRNDTACNIMANFVWGP